MILKTQNVKFSLNGRFSQIASQIVRNIMQHQHDQEEAFTHSADNIVFTQASRKWTQFGAIAIYLMSKSAGNGQTAWSSYLKSLSGVSSFLLIEQMFWSFLSNLFVNLAKHTAWPAGHDDLLVGTQDFWLSWLDALDFLSWWIVVTSTVKINFFRFIATYVICVGYLPFIITVFGHTST